VKKLNKILLSPVTTIVLFVVAAALLLTGTIGGARAAIMQETRVYQSQVQMQDIGVTLLECAKAGEAYDNISWRNYVVDENGRANGTWNQHTGALLTKMIPEGEQLQVGRWYDEFLTIANTGTIDQYSRVTIYKYWIDENGDKVTTMSPDLIQINLTNLGSDWILDEEASKGERIVLYYNRILPSGKRANPFTDKIMIDGKGVKLEPTVVTETVNDNGRNKIIKKTIYKYDGATFVLQAEVDAVQTHNAEDAIRSAWGRKVSIQGGTLSLLQ